MPSIITHGAASAKGYGFAGGLKVPGFITTVDSGAYGTNISGVAYDPDGNMYISGRVTSSFSSGPHVIMKLAANTGSLVWARQVSAGGVHSLAFYNGFLYAYIGGSNVIIKINSSGTLIDQIGLSFTYGGGESGYYQNQLNIDSSGNFYIFTRNYEPTSTYPGATITVLNQSYSVIRSIGYFSSSGGGSGFQYADMLMGVDGQISLLAYEQSSSPYNITGLTINTSGSISSTFRQTTLARFAGNRITDNNGNSYTALANILYKINSSGTLVWEKSLGVTSTDTPALSIDSAGNIYYITQSSTPNKILKLDPNGSLIWGRDMTNTGFGTLLFSRYDDNKKLLYVTGSDFSGTHNTSFAFPSSGPAVGTYTSKSIVISNFTPTITDTTNGYTSASFSTFTDTATTYASSVTLSSYTPPTISSAVVLPA